jgi:hypothetical protein
MRSKFVRTLIPILVYYAVVPLASFAAPQRMQVDVLIPSKAVKRTWSPMDETTIAAGLRMKMADELNKRFRFWDFANDGAAGLFRFTFSIEDSQPNEISVSASLNVKNETRGKFSSVWRRPADLNIFGTQLPGTAVDDLSGVFNNLLLTKYAADIQMTLQKNAPIAEGGKWLDPQNGHFRMVIPLEWSRYEEISQSQFKLECNRRGVKLNLYSVGLGTKATYDGATPAFAAIVIEPVYLVEGANRDSKTRVRRAQQVLNLTARFIFLDEKNQNDISVYE